MAGRSFVDIRDGRKLFSRNITYTFTHGKLNFLSFRSFFRENFQQKCESKHLLSTLVGRRANMRNFSHETRRVMVTLGFMWYNYIYMCRVSSTIWCLYSPDYHKGGRFLQYLYAGSEVTNCTLWGKKTHTKNNSDWDNFFLKELKAKLYRKTAKILQKALKIIFIFRKTIQHFASVSNSLSVNISTFAIFIPKEITY